MKIAYEAKRAFYNRSGLGNYSRGIIEGMIKKNDTELILCTPGLSDFGEKWAEKSLSEKYNLLTPSNNVPGGVWRSFLQAKDLRSHDVDIYHGLSHEVPWNIKSSVKKTVVTIHDLIFMRYPEFFKVWDRVIYLTKLQYAVENADHIIAICEQTKNDLIEFLEVPSEKISVLYQQVSAKYFMPPSQDGKFRRSSIRPYLLNVGALNSRKNHINLIKAFKKSECSKTHDLVLIGRGGLEKKIKAVIESENLQSTCFLHTDVDDDELMKFYQKATALVFPSFFEGFGLPIVESLACGVPVMTSKGSCFPESAGPGALFIDPYSISEMAAAIKSLCNNSELRESLAAKGKEYVKKFTPEFTNDCLYEFYRSIL